MGVIRDGIDTDAAHELIRRVQMLDDGSLASEEVSPGAGDRADARTIEPQPARVDSVATRTVRSPRTALVRAAHTVTAPVRRAAKSMFRSEFDRVSVEVRSQMALDVNHLGHLQAEYHRQLEALGRLPEMVDELITASTAEVVQQLLWSNSRIQATLDSLVTRLDAIGVELTAAGDAARRAESYSLTTAQRVIVPLGPGEVLVRSAAGYVLCATGDESLVTCLADSGDLERGTRLLIERLLSPGDVFVDAGANVGIHSLAAARTVGKEGQVIAFEPYGPIAGLLTRSLALNGYADISHVHTVALSDEQGSRALHLGGVSGHHSLLALYDGTDAAWVDVEVTTLDATLPHDVHIDVMKIDVEGAELAMIRGSSSVLANNPSIGLIVEFGSAHLRREGSTADEWFEVFSSLGFEWRAIDPESGALETWTIAQAEAVESVNLFFAAPESPIWNVANADG